MKKITLLASALLTSASACAVQLHTKTFDIALDTINTPHPLHLTVGVGSGAYHRQGDADNIIYTVSDRGPNIKCKDSKKLIGRQLCKSGKIFPVPQFSPSIYQLKIEDKQVLVQKRISIKTTHHIPVTGISTPSTEPAFDINGQAIADDPNGVDSEALVRTQQGDFYISDEYGPSILHLASDGTILSRWIPKGSASRFTGADYPLNPVLPAILAKRHLNRGIESIALSPDEHFIYFAMQSPLDNPNIKAYKHSRNVRLFKVARATGKTIGEYVYQLDTPDTFVKDSAHKIRKQKDVKVSDMVADGQDKLIVLERINKTTKFYQVDLTNASTVAAKWNNSATSPTLEQQSSAHHLKKSLVFSTDDIANAPGKIEGVAYVNPHLWYLTNDNDFGIDGQPSHIIRVNLP